MVGMSGFEGLEKVGNFDCFSAINAMEVIVGFNMAVDETEGKKATNYTVKKSDDTDLAVTAVSLSEDKMTATLSLTTAMVNYSTNNKITVKKAVGLAADYTGTVGVADETVPALVSVEATGPRQLTLTFSEPVQGATNAAFKLNNGTVALGAITAAGTKLTLATLADLTEGAHTLELLANSVVKDYVNLIVKPGSYAFNYVKDTTAPTVSVKESSEYTVTLKFTKNVNNVATTPVLFSHTYDGQNQVTGLAAVTGTNDEYVVTFINALAPGTSNVYIGYASGTTDANKIKDNFGNVLAPVTLQVTTAVDSIAPVAEKVEFKTSTTAAVTFSEKVTTATAQDKANYTLKDSADATVAISGAVLDGTGKIVTLTFTAINGGDFTLTVKGVKDISIAANKVADTTLVFTATDKVNPTIVDVDTVTGGIQAQKVAAKKVIVKFSEAMDVASITNKANYQFNSGALASGDTITAVDGNKSALFTFAADPTTGTITVGRVADIAGNTIAAFATDVLIPAGVSTPLYDKLEVLNKNTVKLYFKEVITGALANDFAVDPGTGTFEAVTGIAVTVANSKTEITLTIASDIDAADAAALSVEVQTVADASADPATGAVATGAANDYGAKVDLSTPVVGADKMAPSVVANGYETMDYDSDGKIDHIKITFDEEIFVGSVSMEKFTVAGYTVVDAYTATNAPANATLRSTQVVDSAVVYVRVTEKAAADSGATPKVSIAAGVKDVAGNGFAAVADKATKDMVAPIVTSIVVTDATHITVTFSESLTANAPTAAGFAIAGADVGAKTIGSVVASGNTVVITIATEVISTTEVLTIAYTTGQAVEIKDAAANLAASWTAAAVTNGL